MKENKLGDLCQNGAEFFAHSIWLGIFVSAIYLFIVRATKTISPAARTGWGIGLMISIPLGACLFSGITIPRIPIPDAAKIWFPAETVYGLCVVGGFCLILSIACFVFAQAKINRLAGSGEALSEADCKVVCAITHQFGLNSTIPVKVSDAVKGPLLCGLFKPLIILPKYLFEKQNRSCLESVLAHEYAHHQRRDIRWNLVQLFVQNGWWPHLPVRWLSQQIRIEREKACDDLAVKMMNGRSFVYASSLLEVENNSCSNPLALAFGAETTSDRAARIAFGDRRSDLPCSKLLAGLSILIILLTVWVAISVVKVHSFPLVEEVRGDLTILTDPPLGFSIPSIANDLDLSAEWKDKQIGQRYVPMMKSLPLIERDGVIYDLGKPEPVLFPPIANSWLTQHKLNFLSRDLPRSDADGDFFSVLEEYEAGTNPNDQNSHPDSVRLLSFVSREYESYLIKYAARTDEETIQMIRFPTAKYPRKKSFFLKPGQTSPSGRVKLNQIAADSVEVLDLLTGLPVSLKKNESADCKMYFANLKLRSGELLRVKQGEAFYVPGDFSRKWKMTEVSELDCLLESEGKDSVRLSLR